MNCDMRWNMITSDTNGQIKELVKLQKNARYRRKSRCFVAEGIKLTKEAADYGKLQRVYIGEELYRQRWGDVSERKVSSEFHGVPVDVVSQPVLEQISETVTPQGILGVVEMPEYSLEDILSDKRRIFLLLDDLRDPGNLGTILRTSEGADMSGVILSRESVDLFNPKVVRATMGAIFRVPFLYVEDLARIIEEMQKRKIAVYGTMLEGSVCYDQVDYTLPTGIVVGNEANGISEKVSRCLTGRIRIPMGGKLESLNAAVAAAVVMYEAARQRR